MKKIFDIFILSILVVLVSCVKDEPVPVMEIPTCKFSYEAGYQEATITMTLPTNLKETDFLSMEFSSLPEFRNDHKDVYSYSVNKTTWTITYRYLNPGTTYYVRGYWSDCNMANLYLDTLIFTTRQYDGMANDHAYVDLGLSVMWASQHVETHVAWGETSSKFSYDWTTYKYSNDNGVLSKYCVHSADGKVDNKICLGPEDDYFVQNWGGNWRMPTWAEWNELINNCECKTITYPFTGVRFTAKNGNYIDLKNCGYEVKYSSGTGVYYWSSSLYNIGTSSQEAVLFTYYKGAPVMHIADRKNGYALYGVRATK